MVNEQRDERGVAPVPAEQRRRLHARYIEIGEAVLAGAIGISRHGLARAMAGLNVYSVTRSTIARYLGEVGQ